MEALLIYTLRSSLVLTLLYLPYTLMLRRERFFRLNRLTLLAILVLALVQPLVRITIPGRFVPQGEAAAAIADVQEFLYTYDAVTVGAAPSAWGWHEWAVVVYLAGMAMMLCLRACQLLQIHRALRRGCLWRDRGDDGVTVWCHAGDGAPFSWMRNIYISEGDYAENSRAILLHERAHIHCRHSLDILLVTLVEVVQWWNPFVYMLGRSLRDVHEYEADERVLRQDIMPGEYHTLLVRKALADTSYAFANNFTRSHVSQRIAMMKRPPSRPLARGKVLYIVPLLLVTLVLTAAPVMEPLLFVDGEEVSSDRLIQLPTDSIDHIDVLRGPTATDVFGQRARGGAVIVGTKTPPDDDTKVFLIAEQTPEFPGGPEAMKEFLSRHMRYPAEAKRASLQGRIDVTFIVETDGSLSDVHASYAGMDEEGVEASLVSWSSSEEVASPLPLLKEGRPAEVISPPSSRRGRGRLLLEASAKEVVSQMPRWNPARQQGRPVRARVTLPLYYKLE